MTIPSRVTRRRMLLLGTALGVSLCGGPLMRPAAASTPVEVWKDPGCACCNGWVSHMRRSGFSVTVHDSDDMAAIKRARGVPDALQSCHTAIVDGYVIEGHVPAPDIVRLLAGRPTAKGLAVPGMPQSAPGMDQPGEPYAVVMFGATDGQRIFAEH